MNIRTATLYKWLVRLAFIQAGLLIIDMFSSEMVKTIGLFWGAVTIIGLAIVCHMQGRKE